MECTQEGLYLRFRGQCKPEGNTPLRVRVRWENGENDLGILVPEGREFVLSTRIARKNCGDGTPTFHAIPNHRSSEKPFVAVYPEEPFAYLSRLREAYLLRKDGVNGISFRQNSL